MSELVVGLTGGIGSGKSAVSDWFANQGIDVVDADVIAHAILVKGSVALDELCHAFGAWVIDTNGNYNRVAMRQHILAKPNAIATLNAVTHPHIRADIIDKLTKSTTDYCILSVPLLIEGMKKSPNLAELCDRILMVDVPKSLQIKRASLRDVAKLSAHANPTAYIQAIIAKQATRQERLAVADDVVDNGGTLDELYAQLAKLHEYYLGLAGTAN